jgi:hypothetical protein
MILDSSSDEELTVQAHAQVPCSQVTVIVVDRQRRAERALVHLPVPVGHRGSGNPDFANPPILAGHAGIGIDDAYSRAVPRGAARDQRSGVARAGLSAVVPKRLRGHRPDTRCLTGHASRDKEGRLREAVHGMERLAAESARRERLREPLQGRRSDRLRPVVGHAPRGQIQRWPVGRDNSVCTEVVGEVRAAAGRGAVRRDRPQPADRLLQEGRRRHQDSRSA